MQTNEPKQGTKLRGFSRHQVVGYLGFGALLILIVLGAAYSIAVFHNLRGQAEEENLAADLAQAKLGSEFIADHQHGILDRLRAIASRSQFKKALADRSFAELKAFLGPVAQGAEELESVFLTDPQGRLLMNLPGPVSQGTPHQGLPLERPRAWVSPVHPSPIPHHNPVVTLSVPIYGPGRQLAGFLGISQRTDLWKRFFSRLSARPGRTFFLFDQTGRIVASGLDLSASEAESLRKGADTVRREVIKRKAPVARLLDLSQREGRAFMGAAQALSLGWVLAVAHDYEAAMSRTQAMVQNILIFSLLLFLCLLLLVFLLMSRFRGQQQAVDKLDEETRRLEEMVQKRTEDLKNTTELYRSLVEDLPDIVYEVDAKRRFTFVSSSVNSILGYNPGEMLGRTRREFVHPDDRGRFVSDARWDDHDDMMNIMAIRHLRKDGQIRWLSSHSRSLYDSQGRMLGRRGMARDVTEQVVAESRVRELSRKLITAQEEERKRIALDLHDEMGQLLSALKMGLQTLAQQQQGSSEGAEIGKLIQLNQKVMDRTRALAHWLRPAILDNFGLRPALEDLCETLAESHLVEVDQDLEELDEKILSPEVKISLFRFVQEALSNAVKYSGSPNVEVRLAVEDDILKLSVTDFGKGFDLERALSGGKHLGLLGMKERISLIGGDLRIVSSPGGTKLSVELALERTL